MPVSTMSGRGRSSQRSRSTGRRYALKHTTRTARATLEELRYRIDVNTLHRDSGADRLELNEIGCVRVRTSAPLAFDPYARNRATGSFILVDEATNDTVAAGMITGAHLHESSAREVAVPHTPDTTWYPGVIDRATRWAALGHQGATGWLTGLPSSGKSTIATALEARLIALGRVAYVLDGDNLRHGLNGDLGFSERDRAENVRRTAQVARLVGDAGSIALVSLVSPFVADREAARAFHETTGLAFVEVWVSTPRQGCERRDPKGLYARARAGTLRAFTGVDAPYEPPTTPDLELDCTEVMVPEAVERLVDLLRDRRCWPRRERELT